MKIEKQISNDLESPYEWSLEFCEDMFKDVFSGFDVELTMGTRWGNHSYISLGSAFLGNDEKPEALVPALYAALAEITDLSFALMQIKEEITNKIVELDATL